MAAFDGVSSREAEEVLDIKRTHDKIVCLVKWRRLPRSESTYLPLEDVPIEMMR